MFLIKFVSFILLFLCLQGCKDELIKSESVNSGKILSSVFEKIESDYVEPVSQKYIIESVLKNIASHLDKHSSYFPPDEYKKIVNLIKGEFIGIGLEVISTEKGLKVISVFEGTPAYKTGIKVNDIITHIDGESVLGHNNTDLTSKILGYEGSYTTLKAIRNTNKYITFNLIRKKINFHPVHYKKLKNGKIAYIRLIIFNDQTSHEMRKILNQIKNNKNIKGIILDLRDNPGGILEQVVEISGFFLPPKSKIVEIRGRNKQYNATIYTKNIDCFCNTNLVILVNKNSASGSEVLAGALKDYKRATIMGEKTFGKGSVQSLFNLDKIGGMKLTIAHFFTPLGCKIQDIGINPDITLNLDQDTQFNLCLKKAMQYLESQN